MPGSEQTSAKTGTTDGIKTRRSYRLDLLAITVVCVPLYGFLLVTLTSSDILYLGDGAWYLNRAHLLWRGIFDDAFVYTLVYPALIGAVNLVVQNLITAAQIVNWFALYSIAIGTYFLGLRLFRRSIAWAAVLITMTCASLFFVGRLFWPDVLFVAVVVWCVLTYLLAMRHPGDRTAILLGLMLVVVTYTRLEGAAYGILILPVAVTIYRATGSKRQALRFSVLSGGLLGLGIVLYLAVLVRGVSAGNPASFSLVRILTMAPPRWDLVSRRITDTLTSTLQHWPVWAWWIVLGGAIWIKPGRNARWLCLGIIILNMAYTFLLSTWPFPRYAGHFLPFFALLFSATMWHIGSGAPSRKLLTAALTGFLTVPGLVALAGYSQTPLFAYRSSPLAEDGQAIDAWLAQNGWNNTEIYTFCNRILPFTRSNMHLIYRLYSPDTEDTTSWDSPTRLLPHIRETGKLLMMCDDETYYPDWRGYLYLGKAGNYPEQLELVGQIRSYRFYRVTHVG